MNKVDRLQKLILEAEDLIKNSENNSDPKFSAWNSSVIRFIENEFGQKSNDAKNFSNRLYEPAVLVIGSDNSKLIHDVYIRDLKKSLAELKSIYEEILEDDPEDDNKKIIKSKSFDENKMHQEINVTNNIYNNVENNIDISFDNIIEKINDDINIGSKSKKEIVDKIDEIKNISTDKSSKQSKWKKIKPILVFLLDKGADFVVAYFPAIVSLIKSVVGG